MQVGKLIFDNFSGVKGYKKIIKLYAAWEKAKAKNDQKKMQKLSDEIKKEFADTLEGLQRIYKIYSDAEEIKDSTILYTPSQIKSYTEQAKELLTQLQAIGSALGLTQGEANAPA
jgi:hypothetical protein